MKRKSTSRIEHVAADPPEDPDFPMNFGEFAKLTNVLELAKIEIQNKNKIYPKRTRVAYKARVLYKQFYKEPQLRNCAPLNALIWNLRSIVDSKIGVQIKFNLDGLPPLPVAFEVFDRGTNIRDLATSMLQPDPELDVNDEQEKVTIFARLLHALYYELPVTRRTGPLNKLRVRDNCSEEIRDALDRNLSVPEENDLPVTKTEFLDALSHFIAAKKYQLEHTCP